jgi:hypothetical protein
MTKLERKYPDLFRLCRDIRDLPRGRQTLQRGLDWYAAGGKLYCLEMRRPEHGL